MKHPFSFTATYTINQTNNLRDLSAAGYNYDTIQDFNPQLVVPTELRDARWRVSAMMHTTAINQSSNGNQMYTNINNFSGRFVSFVGVAFDSSPSRNMVNGVQCPYQIVIPMEKRESTFNISATTKCFALVSMPLAVDDVPILTLGPATSKIRVTLFRAGFSSLAADFVNTGTAGFGLGVYGGPQITGDGFAIENTPPINTALGANTGGNANTNGNFATGPFNFILKLQFTQVL